MIITYYREFSIILTRLVYMNSLHICVITIKYLHRKDVYIRGLY